MAYNKGTKVPVGSTRWVQDERDQADQFVEQEVEEFGYSVKNELDWLNEHMADVFATHSVNFADVFKTPGKLRGKTPRTARKQNTSSRLPLTNVFESQVRGTPSDARKRTPFLDRIAHFEIAEDANIPTSVAKNATNEPVKQPTDSGYHGQEMEIDHENLPANTQDSGFATQSTQPFSQTLQTHSSPNEESRRQKSPSITALNNEFDEARVSNETFVSAEEASQDLPSKAPINAQEELSVRQAEFDEMEDNNSVDGNATQIQSNTQDRAAEVQEVDMGENELDDDQNSVSEASSPEKATNRKSSFNFSSLPAREPLATNRSTGARNSQIQEGVKYATNISHGKSFGLSHEVEGDAGASSPGGSIQQKPSTQSLHERIKMLGKPKESRLTNHNALYPQLPAPDNGKQHDDVAMDLPPTALPKEQEKDNNRLEDEEDDWIAPPKPFQAFVPLPQHDAPTASPARLKLHQKSISTTDLPSPSKQMDVKATRQQKAMSVYSPLPEPNTPASKRDGGPLSASKSRLYSVFKSARSIFASSASASAAAKLEAHNASPLGRKSPSRPISYQENAVGAFSIPGTHESALRTQNPTFNRPATPERTRSVASFKSILSSPTRKTRSSTESDKRREKERKEREDADQRLANERQKEREKAAKEAKERQYPKIPKHHPETENEEASSSAANGAGSKEANSMPPPPPPKTVVSAGKLKAPGRLAKPTKEGLKSAAKPAPMSIRVASQSQRIHGQREDSVAPQPPPKSLGANGLRPTSTQGNRSTTPAGPNLASSRVRALEAAARKKEQEDREKAKKAELKREVERKRQAKADEDRRQEEARKVEQREREREELRRKQEAERKARDAHDLASAIERERAQQQATVENRPRGDVGGTLRQIASKASAPIERASTAPRPPIMPNPAKPAKRHLAEELDDGSAYPKTASAAPPQRQGAFRNPPSFQQDGAKRRRTLEEDEDELGHAIPGARSSVMAPPKRPSAFKKDALPKPAPSYNYGALPPTNHLGGMFKGASAAQHQLPHGKPGFTNHPSQFASGRIPFADNANPPAMSSNHYGHQSMMHPGFENAAAPSKFKTPARPGAAHAPLTKSAAKSSPMFHNGDAIALPEIATDSEDEDESENEGAGGFRAPSWVASPALRDLLTQQQLVDPESIFGPIGELRMDEVFKGSKNQDRLKRLRERGSSAMWVQNGDAVTQEEKRRDREMREKVVREGGWKYAPSE